MNEHTSYPSNLSRILKPSFAESRRNEINGLQEIGTIKVFSITDIPSNSRIFNSRFVDDIKQPDTNKAFKKSTLVVQRYNDKGKSKIITQA